MIDYESTLEYLYNQLPVFEHVGPSAYKPGLDRVLALSAALGNPHKRIKSIVHIGGTNGKGSTAHTLAAIFQSAGYRTGLFTSPHLVDFRERIRIDGQMISREAVVNFVDRYRRICPFLQPSFFELTTVMAFEYFTTAEVDVAVVEVGLGGRLDSTNIVDPKLCVITNISLDHTSLLGDTLEQIAVEKAGIIKPGVPVVIGEAKAGVRKVFEQRAVQCGSVITFADESNEIIGFEMRDGGIVYHTRGFGILHGCLGGDCQIYNAATVLSAVKQLKGSGFDISDDAVAAGFSGVCRLTGFAGRWMVLSYDPFVVCDTGHNPGGWEYLSRQIASLGGCKHIVVGFVNDKDVGSILKMMAAKLSDAVYYFTAPACKRRLQPEKLQALAADCGLVGDVYESVTVAYKKAFADSGKGDTVFIGGSNYVVAELLADENLILKQ